MISHTPLADYCTVNDYEAELMCERTGQTLAVLAEKVKALIVTRGGEGSDIHVGGELIKIPAAKPDALIDPTGCGDAYRAGLLYGIGAGWDWVPTGAVASRVTAATAAARTEVW